MTDDKDRRLLNTIMDKIYCAELLTQEHFKLSESGTYFVPTDGAQPEYVRCVGGRPCRQAWTRLSSRLAWGAPGAPLSHAKAVGHRNLDPNQE